MSLARRWSLLLLAAVPLAAALPGLAHADANESALLASRLVNFLRFFDWSGTSDGGLTFCFLGADSVRERLLASPEPQRVGSWNIVMRAASGADDLAGCSVLYIDAAWRRANPATGEPLRRHMLTISNSTDFNARGGMIEVVPLNDRLKFSVNLPNIRRAGLQVSSTLLEVATVRH